MRANGSLLLMFDTVNALRNLDGDKDQITMREMPATKINFQFTNLERTRFVTMWVNRDDSCMFSRLNINGPGVANEVVLVTNGDMTAHAIYEFLTEGV